MSISAFAGRISILCVFLWSLYITTPQTHPADHNFGLVEDKQTTMNNLIQSLRFCESGESSLAVGDNGQSLGHFQFQYAIIKDFGERVLGTHITREEYVAIAFSPEKSEWYAREIITRNFQGGLHNWAVCREKIMAGLL